MQLPAADQAIVDAAKVRDYLLSATHAVGRYKAVFFQSLGFRQEEWGVLAADLRRVAIDGVVSIGPRSDFGQK